MQKCKKCGKEIPEGYLLGCARCGAFICPECSSTSMQICPYCYSDLEFFG